MDPNAHRSESRRPGADAYWQRRFFTLLAGLGVIGLLAWACSGVASGGNSSHSSGSGQPSSAAYSSTSPTSPAATSPAPVTSPTATRTTPPATPTASPSASVSPKAARVKAAPKPTAATPANCPAADLVLTVTPSQASYGTRDTPAFQVDIVSTDTAPCNLDTGAEALRLEVRHGSSVAYNSGACLHGAKRHVISLRRGIPVITSMSWNKHQTVTSCTSTVAAATNRTYSAVITAGGAQSPRSSFRLTGTPATPKAAAPAARKTTKASR